MTRLREDWRVARAAHLDLQLLRMPRINMLLIGSDGIVDNVLDMIRPSLPSPTETWRAGAPLDLPRSSRTGTIILREIAALPVDDQLRLLGWLDDRSPRAQVISTTGSPLLPRVQSGRFLEGLYYRLNTVCVDMSA